jgi:hypothetical protein
LLNWNGFSLGSLIVSAGTGALAAGITGDWAVLGSGLESGMTGSAAANGRLLGGDIVATAVSSWIDGWSSAAATAFWTQLGDLMSKLAMAQMPPTPVATGLVAGPDVYWFDPFFSYMTDTIHAADNTLAYLGFGPTSP